HDVRVNGERFHLAMREMQNCATGGLINAAAFHADEAVLYNVDAANGVSAAEFVQRLQHAKRRKFSAIQSDAISPLKFQLDVFRSVTRTCARDHPFVHAWRLCGRGVGPSL